MEEFLRHSHSTISFDETAMAINSHLQNDNLFIAEMVHISASVCAFVCLGKMWRDGGIQERLVDGPILKGIYFQYVCALCLLFV